VLLSARLCFLPVGFTLVRKDAKLRIKDPIRSRSSSIKRSILYCFFGTESLDVFDAFFFVLERLPPGLGIIRDDEEDEK
jgi:hypothetical protein